MSEKKNLPVIAVKFREEACTCEFASKEYSYFLPTELGLPELGDYVVVETMYGPNVGVVSRVWDVTPEMESKARRKVLSILGRLHK